MSIRAFSNRPCPICAKDTLHRRGVCSECGHIQESPGDAWAHRMKTRRLNYIGRYGRVQAANILGAEAARRSGEGAADRKQRGARWCDLPLLRRK